MKRIYFLILLLFSTGLKAQKAPNFEHYKIDIDAPRVNFFDAIEHVDIIRMEETKNSLLSYIGAYIQTSKGIVVWQTGKVFLFDDNGNYKATIDRMGEGPEEYSGITYVWLKNETIELLSDQSRILQRYNLNGEYIETVPVGYGKDDRAASIIPYQGGYMFQALDQYRGKDAGFALVFTDENLKVTSKAIPMPHPLLMAVNEGKRFRTLGSEIFFKKILSDSVYTIKGNRALLRFRFDFGNNWTWNDPESTSSQRHAVKLMLDGDKVFEVLSDVGEKYVTLTYFFNMKNQQKGYINRETGKFFRFDMRKKDKENYDLKFIQWEYNRLVSSIAAYDFEEFMENLDKDQWTVKGGFSLDEILSSENPVLLKIKFK